MGAEWTTSGDEITPRTWIRASPKNIGCTASTGDFLHPSTHSSRGRRGAGVYLSLGERRSSQSITEPTSYMVNLTPTADMGRTCKPHTERHLAENQTWVISVEVTELNWPAWVRPLWAPCSSRSLGHSHSVESVCSKSCFLFPKWPDSVEKCHVIKVSHIYPLSFTWLTGCRP